MYTNVLTEFFKEKKNIAIVFIAFLAAYMTIPNYFELNIMPLGATEELWLSLDCSWAIALNYVKMKDVVWGENLAFTYGPLSHLVTRIGWGENKFSFLFFDFFMLVNYFLVFFISLKKNANKIITTLIIIAICLILPLWIGVSNSVVMMFFLIFWIRLSLDRPYILYYLIQIIIITLLFFIKFNTGLIVLPLFYAGLVCNFYYKVSDKKHLVFYALLPLLLILCGSYILNVALFNYVKAGFEMISGYNEIMFLENQIPGSLNLAILIATLLTLLLTYTTYIKQNKKWLKMLTILFLFGTSIFVIYKQAFVRADVGHLMEFFLHIPLLILCTSDLCNIDFGTKIHKNVLNAVLVFALVCPFYLVFIKKDMNMEIRAKFLKDEYISRFNEFTETSGLFMYNNNIKLPNSILATIGSKTIDVYPWNIQLLLENKLNYLPRPVIQSYTAYTSYLEDLNFNHYNSATAPEFVMYDFASIDGRYPLFDESKVNLALMKNYELAELFDYNNRKVALLRKKVNFKSIKFQKVNEYAMMLGSAIAPKQDIYYEVGVYHTFLGKFVSTIEHAPELRFEIRTKDGTIAEYRTSRPLLNSGFFYDRFINNTESFSSIFDEDGKNQNIKSYTIKPLKQSLFKDKIRITEYKITQ
jgi:hypothetical protein